MKNLIATFALIGLLTAPCADIQAKKPTVKLAKNEHRKISQNVLGDTRKAKALNNLDRLLTLVSLGALGAADFTHFDGAAKTQGIFDTLRISA